MGIIKFIPIVSTIVDLVKKDTPNKGKKLKKQGSVMTVAGGTLFAGISQIPFDEATATINAIANLVAGLTSLIGVIVTAIGASQTKDNPDIE